MDFSELPEAVRTRVIVLAARALGTAAGEQIPSALAAVARFAPAKRAQRGAVPLAAAVQNEPAFRALVAHTAHQELAADPDGRSDVLAVAAAYLAGAELPAEPLGRLVEADELETARHRIIDLERQVAALAVQLEKVRIEVADSSSSAAKVAAGAEADKLRRRLREQGTKVREADRRAELAAQQAEQQVADLRQRLDTAETSLAAAEARAEQASAAADRAIRTVTAQRESRGAEQAAVDRRIDLLLSALSGAVGGLRREWNLATQGELPADLVARRLGSAVPPAARNVPDAGRLTEVLMLPGSHLIVDGYNVTKTGYGELTLTDQRDRLIRSLSGLAARTSAEVTIVFDGAAVAVAQPPGRKIRVLFSPPGVIADDVIRRLVDAEPVGRTLVVATSDRAVVTDVARSGARTVGSTVLLALLTPDRT